MSYMIRFLTFLVCLLPMITMGAQAATGAASDFMPVGTYENLYPYMNNKMRVALNPGTSPSLSQDSISTIARTSNTTTGRRVVARSGTRTSAAGTGSASIGRTAAISTTTPQSRRVVARRTSGTTEGSRTGSRLDSSYVYQTANAYETNTTESLSSDRCLADYIQCMNGYCERKDTEYNRCYCSSKLAQIDSEYQPAIDSLILQILELEGSGTYTEEEMNEYWEQTIGQYTGDNSWITLDNALDINWADTESRVRGQQAFLTGHEYCAQHLRGCYYMAANMRDAYRSEIARDCASYETSLQKVKNVAESVIENYND